MGRVLSFATGSILGIVVVLAILFTQALIPGAIIALIVGWSLLHAMAIWALIEIAIVVVATLAVVLVGLALR